MFTIKKAVRAAAAALTALTLVSTCSAESTNWGLGYPTPGRTPQGMASRESLRELDSWFVGNENERTIYLTFDAGYENGNTERILDTLKKTDVPAAFFLVGTYIRDNPELTARMVADGHIVANHTMTHPDMSAISDMASFKRELDETSALYRELTGQEMPMYYRPPRGVYSVENLKMAKELGYKTIFWSLAYVDWYVDKQPSHDEAFGKLIPRAHPGMVLLLHSTSSTNAEILEELIAKYREMGYEFGTLDQLAAS